MTDDEKLERLAMIEDACWRDIDKYDDDKLLGLIMGETYLDTIERCRRIRTGLQPSDPWPMSDEEQRGHAKAMMDFPQVSCMVPKGRCPVCR